jgi:hypothetical protein
MVMTTRVAVLAPVRAYPRCGNWLCCDDADRADADPVDGPAVYTGVFAEQHFVRQLLGPAAMLMMPRDLFGEMLADRRSRRTASRCGRSTSGRERPSGCKRRP